MITIDMKLEVGGKSVEITSVPMVEVKRKNTPRPGYGGGYDSVEIYVEQDDVRAAVTAAATALVNALYGAAQ